MAENDSRDVPKDYGAEYSEESFWTKVGAFALKAGCEVVRTALILYYCLQDRDTPVWARTVIVSALGYFIVPLDAIPDLTPGVGYADDLGALLMALAAVVAHVKPGHRHQAKDKLKEWFGDGCDD